MHELSYAEGVLEAALRRAAGRPVARLGVRIGCVHRVVAEAFAQSFTIAAVGTEAAQAEVELVVVSAHAQCSHCHHRFTTEDPASACEACGSLDVAVSGGDEVTLEWLQYASVREPASEPVHEHTHSGGH